MMDSRYPFLKNGGEMGELTRHFDWSKTAVGSPDKWPSVLRTTVSIILQSKFPMFLWWGEELLQFYNDAYVPCFGKEGKHPEALGQKGAVTWPEIWDIIKPMIDSVMAGNEATWSEDQLIPIYRNGQLEDVYWTFSYSAVLNEEGLPAGVLVTCYETTQKIEAAKQLAINAEENQRRLLSLFEESPVGIATIIAQDLTFTAANPFYGDLVGRKPEDLIGRPLLLAVPEIEGQGFDHLLREVLRTGIPYISKEVAVDLVRNNRLETIYVDLTYQPRTGQDGHIDAILVVAIDVTRQVQSRKLIEENEAKFRSLIDQAPVATCLWVGRDMVIELANDIMIGYWGKDRSVIGQPLADAVPELKGQPYLDILDNIYATGITHSDQEALVYLNVDGNISPYYFNFTYKPILNAQGEVYGIMNMAIDVSEQVLARQKLEEAEQSMRGAVELAELGVWSIDAATNGLTYSDRLIEWFGYDPDAHDYNEVIPILSKADQERVTNAVARALTPGSNGIYDEIYTVIHPITGKKRILHAHGKTIFDISGKPVRLNGTAQDITFQRQHLTDLEQQVQERTEELAATNEELQATNEELAEANEQLVHSNEELEQYAYVASHDLQEPLRKIQIFSGIIKKSELLPEALEVPVEKIAQAAGRMSLLIRDLLEFSRLIKSDRQGSHVDLNEIIRAVVDDFEIAITEADATVNISQMPIIESISLQMNQLFYNLLSNAIKFRKKDRPLIITVTSEPISQERVKDLITKPLTFARYYHLKFKDNGIGFETQYSEQIFEVFKRLHGRGTYPGSGIGLALCRRIVANHHGVLFAESVPGQGSVFNVILPDVQPPVSH
jgi:PAS domain S-box-containing protein